MRYVIFIFDCIVLGLEYTSLAQSTIQRTIRSFRYDPRLNSFRNLHDLIPGILVTQYSALRYDNVMELLQTLKGHFGRVWQVSWNPEGNVLASCGEDKTIRLWCQESNEPFALGLKTILTDGHQRTIRSVGWSPCGQYLASASFDSTVAIWNKKSGQFECDVSLEGHENEVKSVAWSKSGQYLATCSRDKSVWIWEASDEEEYECAAVLNAHSQDVKKVIWHPHVDVVASASYDNTLKVFQCDANECEWICASTLRSHESTVWSLAFDASGKRLASCSDDQTVKVWQQYEPNNEFGIATPDNEAVWKCVCTIAGYHTRTVYDISWCHLTDLIATGCADDGIRIFREADSSDPNEPTFQQLVNYGSAHKQDVNTVQWNPAHRGILASCSDDGEIKIWKVNEGVL